MNLSLSESISIGAVVIAILMMGSGKLKFNLLAYSLQTALLAIVTILHGTTLMNPDSIFAISVAIVVLKSIGIPYFLNRIITRIDVKNDPGTLVPIPMTMHASLILFGLAHVLATSLPKSLATNMGDASAAIGLLLIGILFMLTRRTAVSQVLGFLTMENGIFLFALTQTKGMPMLVEMGVFLDVLVGVMIAGLFIFRIQKSFEHIDVTQLTGLRD